MSRTPPKKSPQQPQTVTPDRADVADLDILPIGLEEQYALLVDLATNAPDKPQRQELEHRTPVPRKCRVEFARLATRARLIRLLLSFFAGGRVPQLMRDYDISWADIQIGRLCDSAGYGRAWEYVERSRDDLLALKAQARAEAVLDGSEAGKGEAQLIRFFLERLRAGRYGDPRYLQGPTQYQGGGGVTYQITINQAASPQSSPGFGGRLCGGCVDIPADDSKTAEKIPLLCQNT